MRMFRASALGMLLTGGAMERMLGAHPHLSGHFAGPGRRNLYTLFKSSRRNRYRPHQGPREMARRRRQMGLPE